MRILLVSTLLCWSVCANSQTSEYRFENISLKHSTLHSAINAIEEDEYGFLWFGSNAGLFRFDGIDFIAYKHDPMDSTSLSSPGVRGIASDDLGHIWASSNYGINSLNRKNNRFDRYAPFNIEASTKGTNNVNELFVDSNSQLWTGGNKSLYRFDQTDKSFDPVINSDDPNMRYSVRSILERDGALYCALYNGLIRVDTSAMEFEYLLKAKDDSDADLNFFSIKAWKNNSLLIGTAEGLSIYDIGSGELSEIGIAPEIDKGLVRQILIDKDSMVWLAVGDEGLFVVDLKTGEYRNFKHDDEDINSIHHNTILSMHEDQFDNIWIGTASGLSKMSTHDSGIAYYQLVNGFEQSANHLMRMHRTKDGAMWFISATGLYYKSKADSYAKAIPGFRTDNREFGDWIYEDDNENIWIPVTGEGFHIFNKGGVNIGNLDVDKRLGSTKVYKIIEDNEINDKLWIGTVDGLCEFDIDKTTFRWHEPASQIKGLSTDRMAIFEQLGDHIWLYYTYFNSLGRMDKGTGEFELYRPDEEKQYILEGTIKDIGISKDSNVWLATLNGLARYDITANDYQLYTTHNGLSNNNLNALYIDQNENIWVSGDRFVARFDPEMELFQNYGGLDKVKNFWSKSKFRDDRGRMYFGGLDGYYVFHPDSLQYEMTPARLVLTDLKVLGRSLKSDMIIEDLDNILLKPNENDLTFDFVGIQFDDPDEIRYRCKLEGYDESWRELSNVSIINYTKLGHGDYVFRAQTSSLDGVWCEEELRIELKIKTPFAKTNWFRSMILLLALILLYLSFRVWHYQQSLRKQKEFAERSSEYKMKFLSHASHEIRTPMNAILGLSGMAKETKLDPTQKEYIEAIEQSSKSLLKIINELLDHTRLESGKFSFTRETFSLTDLLSHLKMMFSSLASQKDLAFTIDCPDEIPSFLVGDEVRLKQILTNLIANAIKYTETGRVDLIIGLDKLEMNNCRIRFVVKDTGIGIAEDKLATVFDRFSKYDDSNDPYSSGLGMFITRELVEAQKGSIHIESELSKGTMVQCIIPYGIAKGVSDKLEKEIGDDMIRDLSILIVDDAEFNHLVLTEMLKKHSVNLKLYKAYNGEEAVENYKANDLDLIILDAKMPVMDGLEASRIIRSLESDYGKVKILGATAGAMPDQIQECLDSGMDAVITKPISKAALFEHIIRLTHDSDNDQD